MKVEELIHNIEVKEKRARKLSLIFTAIPIITAMFLIYFTSNKVIQAQNELTAIEDEYVQTQTELGLVNEENNRLLVKIDSVNKDLQIKTDSLETVKLLLDEIEDFRNHIVRFNWTDQKSFFSISRNQGVQRLFRKILQLKDDDVFWMIGGSSPETGFDSPSFAAYALRTSGVMTGISTSNRYNLQRMLRAIPEQRLKPGDLIFYRTGYAMFYMEYRGQKVAVGMTPAGIRVLQMDFAEIVGYHQIPVTGAR